ncbi:TonB-dependent receptor [soil metagenome]
MNRKAYLLVSTAAAACFISSVAFAQAAQGSGKTAPVLQNAAPGSAAAQVTATTGVNSSANPHSTANSSDNTIGEIIVTAEKREQSLQQVPVAISAFTAEKRDLVGIVSIVDQTNYTPGLTYQPALDRLSLRGVGRLTNSHAADSGTAIYVDGVFTTSTFEAGRSPLFVERTEILRGPQGTLYGRNAIGGAYNVISKRPSRDFSGEFRAGFGNYGRKNFEGTLSIPITDWLRTKISYSKVLQDEGFSKNYLTNYRDENGVKDRDFIEGQVEGEIGKLDFWGYLSKNIWTDNSATPGTTTNGGSFAPNEINPYGTGGGVFPNASFGYTGGLNTVAQGPIRGNPNLITGNLRDFEHDTSFVNNLHSAEIARLHLTYHFPQFDLKYIGGFQRYDYTYDNDTDGTSVTSYQIPLNPTAGPVAVVGGRPLNCFQLQAFGACGPATAYFGLHNTYEEDEEFYSHEFNIASTWDGPLQYIAGVYFYHEKYQYPQNVYGPNQPQLSQPGAFAANPGITTTTVAPANPQRLYLHTNNFFSVSSKAVFGQVDYKLLDTVKLTGGLRYTNDEKKGTEEERIICYAQPACGASASNLGTFAPAVDITLAQIGALSAAQIAAGVKQQGVIGGVTYDPVTGNAKRKLRDGWNDVTGTAGVEWTPDRRTLVYGKYSRGYKAGGFNAAVAAGFSQFPYTAPEQIDNFEVGLKKDWTRNFQTNITGFYGMYYNAQVPLTVAQAQGPAISVFYNVPRSVIQGVELESVWNPISRLNILVSYAYLDSHVTKACCVSDPNDPTATQPGATPSGSSNQGAIDTITGLPARGQDLAGASLPLSPKNKVSINANYTLPVGRYGDLIGSASYLWRDQQYSSFFNRAYNLAPSRDQVDLRVTFRDAKRRFDIIAYAQNVFDSTDFETISGTRYSTGAVYTNYVLTDPRTFGIELQARFEDFSRLTRRTSVGGRTERCAPFLRGPTVCFRYSTVPSNKTSSSDKTPLRKACIALDTSLREPNSPLYGRCDRDR